MAGLDDPARLMVRPAYHTRSIEPFEPRPLVATSLVGEPLVVAAGTLVVVGQGLESLVRQDVWRRLAHGEWGCDVPFAQVAVGATDFDLARASVPRSRHCSVYLSEDADWLTEATGGTDVVAWCPGSSRAWAGLATEDAWDEVCAAIRRTGDVRG